MNVELLKAQLEEVQAQLQNVWLETAGWRNVARSACAKGLSYTQKTKKMKVLIVVQSYMAEHARMN